MKAAAFEYVRAKSSAEVCRLLAATDDRERKIIAGGQTLVPLMAMRLARPDVVIDINDLVELSGIHDQGSHLTIGALTRQREVERSSLVSRKLPLLARAVRYVGHQQTRNRGTVGGSIVHGDPTAEIPLAALALDAVLVIRDTEGEHSTAIDGFHEAAMVTALRPDQLLAAVRFPVHNAFRSGCSFHETSSRAGDFAIVAAAASIELNREGAVSGAALVAGGVAPAPLRLRDAEAVLLETVPDDTLIGRALDTVEDVIVPDSDVHATADYRRRVVRRLLERSIRDSLRDATA